MQPGQRSPSVSAFGVELNSRWSLVEDQKQLVESPRFFLGEALAYVYARESRHRECADDGRAAASGA